MSWNWFKKPKSGWVAVRVCEIASNYDPTLDMAYCIDIILKNVN